MKSIVLLSFLIGAIIASPVESEIRSGLVTYEISQKGGVLDLLKGFIYGVSFAAKGDWENIENCVYGFPCAFNALSDFVYFLTHMQKFDFEEVLEKFIKYVVLGLTGCLTPCATPAIYIVHFFPLFSNFNTNGLIQTLLLGMALAAQDIIMNAIDLFQALFEGDFLRVGIDMGESFWAIVMR